MILKSLRSLPLYGQDGDTTGRDDEWSEPDWCTNQRTVVRVAYFLERKHLIITQNMKWLTRAKILVMSTPYMGMSSQSM